MTSYNFDRSQTSNSHSKKGFSECTTKTPKLLLRLNNYNPTLLWIPGKEMVFTDHLSHNVSQKKF